MLFDIKEYIDVLREMDDTREIIEKYEKNYWPFKWNLKEEYFYLDYLDKFKYIPYKIPSWFEEDFDWEVFLKLAAWSLSAKASLVKEWDEIELYISVEADQWKIVKKVSELWGFQIYRLHELFVEEILNYYVLLAEDENEWKELKKMMINKISNWDQMIDLLNISNNTSNEESNEDKINKLKELL